MVNRKSVVVALGVVALALAASSSQALEPITRESWLTFSRPVALPGVTLDTGTYVFEVLLTSANIVRVSSGDRQRVYYMGFTRVVERPRAMDKPSVTFGEAVAGAAPPITAWFPQGSRRGHQFIYR